MNNFTTQSVLEKFNFSKNGELKTINGKFINDSGPIKSAFADGPFAGSTSRTLLYKDGDVSANTAGLFPTIVSGDSISEKLDELYEFRDEGVPIYLQLMAGSYTISEELALESNVHIIGLSPVVLITVDANITASNGNVSFQNLAFNGPSTIEVSGSNIEFDNCVLQNAESIFTAAGGSAVNPDIKINQCTLKNSDILINGDGHVLFDTCLIENGSENMTHEFGYLAVRNSSIILGADPIVTLSDALFAHVNIRSSSNAAVFASEGVLRLNHVSIEAENGANIINGNGIDPLLLEIVNVSRSPNSGAVTGNTEGITQEYVELSNAN